MASDSGHKPEVVLTIDGRTVAAPAGSREWPSWADWLSIVPPWERKWAVVCNLGWDAEPKLLLDSAKQLLNEAGVQASDYEGLQAIAPQDR